MTRTTRRLFFYFLVIIFILAAPLTILYSTGFSFDFQNYRLVRNGGLYLKSTPAEAKIILNDQNKGATERLISNLLPRTYNISIMKDGYYPWQKKLEVLPGLVTEARNIFLFPKIIQPELIKADSTSTLEDFLKNPQEKQRQSRAGNIASTTAGWTLQNDYIYNISGSNFILYRQNLNDSSNEQISSDSLPTGQYSITTNDGSRFLIISDIGHLYYFDRSINTFQFISPGVKGGRLAGDNKKFIFWNDNEIWAYYVADFLIQPYKKTNDKELITRYSQKISQVIFYPDNEHIAFVVNDQIKITELDGRDQRNTIDFLTASRPQIYSDQQNSLLYYLAENKIFRIKLP